jgi:hypothetical protein
MTLCFGAVNSTILFVVVRWIYRVHALGRATVCFAASGAFLIGTVWFSNSQFRDFRIRIFDTVMQAGVLMATGQEGLEAECCAQGRIEFTHFMKA